MDVGLLLLAWAVGFAALDRQQQQADVHQADQDDKGDSIARDHPRLVSEKAPAGVHVTFLRACVQGPRKTTGHGNGSSNSKNSRKETQEQQQQLQGRPQEAQGAQEQQQPRAAKGPKGEPGRSRRCLLRPLAAGCLSGASGGGGDRRAGLQVEVVPRAVDRPGGKVGQAGPVNVPPATPPSRVPSAGVGSRPRRHGADP